MKIKVRAVHEEHAQRWPGPQSDSMLELAAKLLEASAIARRLDITFHGDNGFNLSAPSFFVNIASQLMNEAGRILPNNGGI